MTSHISLEQIDRSGALRELADEAGALDMDGTRRDMLRRSGIAGAGFVAGGVLFNGMLSPAQAAGITFSTKKKSAANDAKIANYALTLEYLEAAFYKEAVDAGKLHGEVRVFARKVARDEATHVAALRKALGSAAQASPKFDFHGTTRSRTKFLQTSYALENTGVSAYLGQAGNIKTPSILLTAASIVTVEARHSGAVGQLLGRNISPSGAFDAGKTMDQVLAIVNKTKFIRS
jgi:rubrerythrin